MRFLRLCELAAVGSAALFIGLWLGAAGEPRVFGPLRVTVGMLAAILCVAACAGYVSGINEKNP